MSYTGGLPLNGILVWGAANIGPEVGTRVLAPGFDSTKITNISKGIMIPRNGVLRGFTARHNQINGNGNNVVYAIRLNGVITLMTVTLPAQNPGQVSSPAQLLVNIGDVIECVCSVAVNLGNGTVFAQCACEIMGATASGTPAPMSF